MSRKVARVTEERKLLLANEVIESNKYSLNEKGTLYTKSIHEDSQLFIDEDFIEVDEFAEGYPFVKPIIDDSLILWLDGTTGNNYDKTSIWKDLSGSGNDGELVNFGYTEDSGWVDGGLKFDGVDDYVQLPDLALNPDNFTIQVDNKIRAFNGDKVITENGDEWGRNLVIGSNYLPMNGSDNGNHYLTLVKQDENGEDYFSVTPVNNGNIYFNGGIRFSEPRYEGEIYTLSFDIMTTQNSNWGFYFYTNRSGNLIVGNNPSTNGKWERFTYTFTQESTKDDNILFGFHQLIAGEEIGWRKLKLEKGSQATPWTPAPEDIIETNIINHNTPFVENKKVHSYKLYNRALTDEEILQNYRAGQCSPLLAMRGDIIG